MVQKLSGLRCLFFFFILFVFSMQFIVVGAASGKVTFSKMSLVPDNADEETEIVFKVMVTSQDQPDNHIELVVEQKSIVMAEVDPGDTEYSDGKEFVHIGKFSEGPRFYFYRCGNDSTQLMTFNVEESRFFEEYHPDLVLAMALYIPPLCYIIILLRRFMHHTVHISRTLGALGIELREEISGTGRKDIHLDRKETGNDSEGKRDKGVGK